MWSRLFESQAYNRPTYQFDGLPIYETGEFDFYRCVEFNGSFYGKLVYELHKGNLRFSNGRYSSLFPNQKISYWAGSKRTAIKEMRAHNQGKNYICFWAYDDGTSTFPLYGKWEDLLILDGRKEYGIAEIINKAENNIPLTKDEKSFLDRVMDQNPDCLAYSSFADNGGENFIFFESGFKKLAIREVQLSLNGCRNRNAITCAVSCDYNPYPKSYAESFQPIARVGTNQEFLKSKEFKDFEDMARMTKDAYLRRKR